MKPPGLTMQTEQSPPQGDVEERVVFYLRADQYASLHAEAVRHAVSRRQHGAGKRGQQINISQVIRDALVAAGVIDP